MNIVSEVIGVPMLLCGVVITFLGAVQVMDECYQRPPSGQQIISGAAWASIGLVVLGLSVRILSN